ncbi:MAG TPA: glycosyltransferase [Solirubrobacteraceae bacterium]|nr:glycosyltransferase [Solirubrobacteraceae bacterium]
MAAPRRLRVLYLLDRLVTTGGAERFAFALATHLPRDRFELWVCYTRVADEEPLQVLRSAGIPAIGLGRRAKWDVHRFGGLLRLLREQHFDLLHTHKFGSNVWGTLLGRIARVPSVIAHEHTWSYQGAPLRVFLDGQVVGRLADRFIAVSPADAERMVQVEHVPANKVMVIPTAYIPRAKRPATDVRRELGLPPEAPVIVTASLLRPQKATEVLLAAHAEVLRQIPDAQLVIAGDGPQREFLEDRARALELDGHVHFLGLRDDVDAIIASADVGALSSDYEGMPLFLLECMANRTPLVATAVGGIPSVIEDGTSGVLVPPRDPSALAAGLCEVLVDPERRRRIADAALERVAPFRIEAVTEQFVDLYQQLAAEAAS